MSEARLVKSWDSVVQALRATADVINGPAAPRFIDTTWTCFETVNLSKHKSNWQALGFSKAPVKDGARN